MVALEGDGAPVVVEEVGFYCDLLGAPDEVDLPSADPDVDLGAGEGVAGAEGEEGELQVVDRALGRGDLDAEVFGSEGGVRGERAAAVQAVSTFSTTG
ncbi:MAG: hypothetical protein AB7T48_11985 [Solirubrobacterales bacterium]